MSTFRAIAKFRFLAFLCLTKRNFAIAQNLEFSGINFCGFSFYPLFINIKSDLRNVLTWNSESVFSFEDYSNFDWKLFSNFRHSKMHIPESSQRKIYQCSQCSFTTKVSGHLTRHYRIHEKVKPYKCPYCEYSSNNSVWIIFADSWSSRTNKIFDWNIWISFFSSRKT